MPSPNPARRNLRTEGERRYRENVKRARTVPNTAPASGVARWPSPSIEGEKANRVAGRSAHQYPRSSRDQKYTNNTVPITRIMDAMRARKIICSGSWPG